MQNFLSKNEYIKLAYTITSMLFLVSEMGLATLLLRVVSILRAKL